MDRLDKIKEIEKLSKDMIGVIKEMTVIASKPKPKYNKIAVNRAFKMMVMMFTIRSIHMQIKLVQSQRTGNFPIAGIIEKPKYELI